MTFDQFFGRLVRLTGWGLGVYVVAAGKLDPTQTVALIIAFVGFEIVTRARDRRVPELTAERQKIQNEETTNDQW